MAWRLRALFCIVCSREARIRVRKFARLRESGGIGDPQAERPWDFRTRVA